MIALPNTKASKSKVSKSQTGKPRRAATFPKLPLTGPVNDPLIQRLIELLPGMLEQDFSAEELARQLYVSYSTLRHRFKEATGVSLWSYVRWLRLETARQMFEQGTWLIKDVLAQVGVREPNHFRHDFQAAYGLTPSDYCERYGRNAAGY